MVTLNAELVMAVMDACRCARSFRVVVLVLIGSTLVGLCLPTPVSGRVPEGYTLIRSQAPISRSNSQIRGVLAEDSETYSTDAAPNTFRPRDSISQSNVTVRMVALKHVVGERGELRGEELDSNDGAATLRGMDPTTDSNGIRIGKLEMVTKVRGRALRTSKPYPCSLPSGSCKPSDSCCGRSCANFAVNPNHCGRCGRICKPDRACCGGKCRRLATDEKSCGSCGTRCAPGTRCVYGLCGY